MNVVFLSPHFPPHWRFFAMRLRDLGATVLGIADAPYDQLHPELRAALTEYYRVDDTHDEDALIRALGWLTHRHGKIDRLDSLNEYWLEIEARLRTDFNIAGITTTEIDRVKRKSQMKRVFERAGVRVARGRVCRTPSQVRRCAAVELQQAGKTRLKIWRVLSRRVSVTTEFSFQKSDSNCTVFCHFAVPGRPLANNRTGNCEC